MENNDISELVMLALIFLIVMFIAYKFIRAIYLHTKYKKCPKCGHVTLQTTEIEYSYADQDTYEVIHCTNVKEKCNWKYKFKY